MGPVQMRHSEPPTATVEPTPVRKPRRRLRQGDVISVLVLLGITFALWIPRLGGPIDLRTDAAVYYITGVALAEGDGYVLKNEPGDIAAVQYPPGLPAIVAVHRWIVGNDDPQVLGFALRITYLLIALAYTVAVYVMARQLLEPGYALVVGLITALFLQTYFLSNALFAEIPFALVTMLFLIASRRAERRPQAPAEQETGPQAVTATNRHRLLPAIAAGVLAVTAYLLRTAGIAVLAAWVGEAVLRRHWKQAAIRAIVAVLPVIAWQGYVASVTGSAAYASPAYEYQRADYMYYNVPYGDNVRLVDPFQPELGRATAGDVAERIATNIVQIPRAMGHSVSTVPGYYEWTLRDAHNWLGVPKLPLWLASGQPVALGLLVIAGAVILAIHREWLIFLYGAFTIGLVCLTPWPQQFTRYLTPLTPILALALVVALAEVRSRLPLRSRWVSSALVAVVVGLVLVMQAYSLVRAFRSGWTYVPEGLTRVGGARIFFFDDPWVSYATAVDWLRGRAGEGDVVAACTPQWAYVAGEYKAVMPPMEDDPAEAQRLMDTVPVRYAIVDEADVGEITSRYLAPVIAAHPSKWRLVYTVLGTNTRVYERVGAE